MGRRAVRGDACWVGKGGLGVLDYRWRGRVGGGTVSVDSGCDEELGIGVELNGGFAIGEDIHYCVLDGGVR